MIIFLIGFMGSGKSFWAKRLAQALDCSHIDLDERVVELENASIAAIFAEKGESYFRAAETLALKNIIEQYKHTLQNTVIATGGGTPTIDDNMNLMLENGCVLYLSASPTLLAERLQAETEYRPLLRDKNPIELAHFITNMLEKREPFYERAHFIVRQNENSQKVLSEILHGIETFQCEK